MLKIFVMSVLLACGAKQAFAQEAIIISDSLTANADVFPATVATSFASTFMKFPKLNFGDYKVVSGKRSLTLRGGTTTFLGNSVTKSFRKFSFILTCKANESVKVNGELKTVSQSELPVQVSTHLTFGSYQYKGSSVNFSANIAVIGDSSHMWTLSIKIENRGEADKYEGFLTDGKRNILISPVRTTQYALPDYSDRDFEFAENDHFYSACRLIDKGPNFSDTYKIYLEKSLDPKMKLVLSAAMAAILEAGR